MGNSNERSTSTQEFVDGWTRAGMFAAMLGIVVLVFGLAMRTTADPIEIQVVPLHNQSAERGSPGDCPPGPAAAWHFVLAPNNGQYRFVSIGLDLSGTFVTVDAGDLILNSGQLDNVFVRVPAGYALTDLRSGTSFAEVTPSGRVKFVLSHICPGGTASTTTTSTTTTTPPTSSSSTTTTTSTSTTSTTTTTPPTSSSSTTTTTTPPTSSSSTTTTTTPPTSSSSTTTTTTPPTSSSSTSTSTTTTVEQRPPATTTTTVAATTTSTTTIAPSTTTTVAASTTTTTVAKSTAVTGGGGASRTLILIGTLMLLIGTSLVLGAWTRRPGEVVGE